MAYSEEQLAKLKILADSGTISQDKYNTVTAADWDEKQTYVAPGYTSWGAPLTGGQTRAEADTSSYNQAIQSTTDQLSAQGYTSPTAITPGTNYNVGAGGVMTPNVPTPTQQGTSPLTATPISNTQSGYGVANTGPTNVAPSGVANPSVNGLLGAQYAQGANQLDFARQNALSNLGAEQAEIQPYYYDERNRYAAQQALARRAELERQASQGLGGGVSTQGEIARSVALQGNLGALGRDETESQTDIARRRSDVENQYQFGLSDLSTQQQIAQMEYDLEQQAITDAQTMSDQEGVLFQQLLAEMSTFGNADTWYRNKIGEGVLSGDMLNKLGDYVSYFTPEEVTDGVGGTGPTQITPEQIGAIEYVYNEAVSMYGTGTQAISSLERLRTEGPLPNIQGKPVPPKIQLLYNNLKKLTDDQFLELASQLGGGIADKAQSDYTANAKLAEEQAVANKKQQDEIDAIAQANNYDAEMASYVSDIVGSANPLSYWESQAEAVGFDKYMELLSVAKDKQKTVDKANEERITAMEDVQYEYEGYNKSEAAAAWLEDKQTIIDTFGQAYADKIKAIVDSRKRR